MERVSTGISAEAVLRLARVLATAGGTQPTLDVVVVEETRLVPARWAVGLVADHERSTATMAAATDESVAGVIAEIVDAADASPRWTAFTEGVACHVPDLRTEHGFATYTREMTARTPVRSVLSVPLTARAGVVGVLTLYSDRPRAFGPTDVEFAVLLGAYAGLALATADAEARAVNLQRALASNRTIGAAIGILVERHRLTQDEAFDMLRHSSHLTNRKLSAVAADLVACGELPRTAQALARTASPAPRR